MDGMAAPPPGLFSPEFARDPYAAYRLLRESYPLLRDERLGWIVSRHVDVSRVLGDPMFSTRNYAWQLEPVLGRTILQMDGREHAAHRRVIAPAFRGVALSERLEPLIAAAAQNLLDSLVDEPMVDLVSGFCQQLPIMVIVDLLGLPSADRARFQSWYRTFGPFMANNGRDPEVHASGLRARDELRDYLTAVITRRRAQPGEDLLSSMCLTEITAEPMSDEDITSFCSLLLSAGGETTDKALACVLRNLVEYPGQQADARSDPAQLQAAIAETLRHTPPTLMISRVAEADAVLSGGTVPAGGTVTCLLAAANRDPERFRNPDAFDIRRGDLAVDRAYGAGADHVSFGQGRHFCVGAQLAKAELTIGVRAVLEAYPTLRYAGGFVPSEGGVLAHAPTRLVIDTTTSRG